MKTERQIMVGRSLLMAGAALAALTWMLGCLSDPPEPACGLGFFLALRLEDGGRIYLVPEGDMVEDTEWSPAPRSSRCINGQLHGGEPLAPGWIISPGAYAWGEYRADWGPVGATVLGQPPIEVIEKWIKEVEP